MYIQCTQKLLAKLTMPHGELPNPPDVVYCWHANYFENGALVYVVMMNDDTGEELFFPVESFQDFGKQVLSEMKLDMKYGGATAKEIKAYLQIAGPLTFGPTSDRSLVAQISGYTRRMKSLVDSMYDLRNILEGESELDDMSAQIKAMIDTLAESQDKKKPNLKLHKKPLPNP